MEDEYELIPLSPIRKLEKRLDRVEKTATTSEMLSELMDIVKTNQHVVDQMSKTNSTMINKVTDLSNTVDKLIARMDDFMSRIEVSSPEAPETTKNEEEEKKWEERIGKLEKRLNSLLLSSMAVKRQQSPQPMMRRPEII